jgi:hypothetical protein
MYGAGLQVFLQPVLRIESPPLDGKKQGVHHGGQFRTPFIAGPIEVLAPYNGAPYCLLPTVVIHGDVGKKDKYYQSMPVSLQAEK